MNFLNTVGNYVSDHTWYAVLIVAIITGLLFWRGSVTNKGKNNLYTFSFQTHRILYSSIPSAVFGLVILLYSITILWGYQHDPVVGSFFLNTGLVFGGVGLFMLVVGVSGVRIAYKQWNNRRPDQSWYGPFN